MSRRIIGQCNTADFKDIEYLASLTEIQVYSAYLTGRQKAAVRVLAHFQSCGVPFEVLLKLREVLVWEMPDKGLAFEYKLLDARDIDTQRTLLNMAPRKLS